MGGKHIIFTDKCADLCACSSSLLWFHLKAPFLFISSSFCSVLTASLREIEYSCNMYIHCI